MMRMLVKLLKWLALLILLLLAIGFFLPAKYSSSRAITINAPVEKVQALIDSPKEWKRWSIWNQRDPNMEMTYSGPERGNGAKWTWKSQSQGNGGMEFLNVQPGKKVGYKLQFETHAPADGDLVFESQGSGTKVTWNMYGDAGMNPVNRWFGFFMDRLVGPDFEAGLKNLKALAEK